MNKPLRTILIDDEDFCRRDLADLLKSEAQVSLIDEASNLREAQLKIELHKPDLVFLDLNLAGQNGFKLFELPATPAVIAVTAFSQHAMEGYTHNVVDYILKPVEQQRLKIALRRARDQILLRSLKSTPAFRLEINGQTTPLGLSDIYWVKSSENYVEVCSTLGRGLIRSTFTKFRQKLPPGFTLEISRGHIVARHQIKSWKRGPHGHLEITLKCGAIVGVSKRLRKGALEQIQLTAE